MSAVAAPAVTPYRIPCGAIWGGIEPVSLDLATSGVAASLHSTASGGRRGGDIYYLSVCSSDLLTRVAVADVRGHGEQVSEISGWLYRSLHDKMNTLDGAGVLSDLNALVRSRGFEAITTAAVVSFYLGDSMLYYSYAGHPPALARRSGGQWEPLPLEIQDGPANLPLGVLRNARYEQRKIRMSSGDRFFLYTDGVSESAGPDPDDPFGEQRLLAVLEQCRDLTVSEVKNAVVERLTDHAGGALVHDDCTMMVVEIR